MSSSFRARLSPWVGGPRTELNPIGKRVRLAGPGSSGQIEAVVADYPKVNLKIKAKFGFQNPVALMKGRLYPCELLGKMKAAQNFPKEKLPLETPPK